MKHDSHTIAYMILMLPIMLATVRMFIPVEPPLQFSLPGIIEEMNPSPGPPFVSISVSLLLFAFLSATQLFQK